MEVRRENVGWESDRALNFALPIIVVNLKGKRTMDPDLCHVLLRTGCTVHEAYKRANIKYAHEHFPGEFAGRNRTEAAARHYDDDLYRRLGIE